MFGSDGTAGIQVREFRDGQALLESLRTELAVNYQNGVPEALRRNHMQILQRLLGWQHRLRVSRAGAGAG